MKKISIISLIILAGTANASTENDGIVEEVLINKTEIKMSEDISRDDNCILPLKNFEKPIINDVDRTNDEKVDEYNKKVDEYNKKASEFKKSANEYLSCVDDYVKKNEKELEKIKIKTEVVILEANKFIEENKK